MRLLNFGVSLAPIEALAFKTHTQGTEFRGFHAGRWSACAPYPSAVTAGERPHSRITMARRKRPRCGSLSATACQNGAGDIATLDRIDVAGLSASQIAKLVDFSRPCILTGVLPSPDCEDWCDAMLEDLGEETCAFQIRCNESGRSEVFESTLLDFVQGLQDESTHDDSW